MIRPISLFIAKYIDMSVYFAENKLIGQFGKWYLSECQVDTVDGV